MTQFRVKIHERNRFSTREGKSKIGHEKDFVSTTASIVRVGEISIPDAPSNVTMRHEVAKDIHALRNAEYSGKYIPT